MQQASEGHPTATVDQVPQPAGAPLERVFGPPCKRCGRRLEPGGAFCSGCGSKVTADGYVYATFGSRLGAYVIYWLVSAAMQFAAGFTIGLMWAFTRAPSDGFSQPDTSGLQRVVVIVGFTLAFLYAWRVNTVGQGLGKRVAGIRVVRLADGGDPGWRWGLVRTLGYLVCSVPVGLGFLWAARDPRHQGWHDKLAGTIVVRD